MTVAGARPPELVSPHAPARQRVAAGRGLPSVSLAGQPDSPTQPPLTESLVAAAGCLLTLALTPAARSSENSASVVARRPVWGDAVVICFGGASLSEWWRPVL